MLVDNILSVYHSATPAEREHGTSWYAAANAFAKSLDFHYVSAAGVIAALSPRQHWDVNKRLARLAYDLKGYDVSVIVNDVPGGNYLPTFNVNARKALAIVNGADPFTVVTGQKTRAFMLNIAYPFDVTGVTIDKHAADVAEGRYSMYQKNNKPLNPIPNKSAYLKYVNAYLTAARECAILPHVMQATTWIAWRNQLEG